MPTTKSDLLDLIHLAMVPGVGPQISRALLERFGSAGARARGVARRPARRRGRRPQARRQDRAGPPGLRRRRRAGPLPARWASASSRAAIPIIRRRSRTFPTRPACSTSRDDSSRATSSPSRWSARGTARPTAMRIAERLAAGAGADRVHGGLGPGARHRRGRAPRRDQGRRPHASASWPTAWRRSTRPSTKSWPGRSPRRAPS